MRTIAEANFKFSENNLNRREKKRLLALLDAQTALPGSGESRPHIEGAQGGRIRAL
jgi:hypothetical protein